jgi:hypothetical protein
MLFFVNLGGSHKSKHKSYPPPPITNDSSVSNEPYKAYNTYKSYIPYKAYKAYT